MSPFKEVFSELKPVTKTFVSMADDKKCEILGIGTVCLKFENGYVLNLKDVRYVPDLCYNLMSCTALENEGMGAKLRLLELIMAWSFVIIKWMIYVMVLESKDIKLCLIPLSKMGLLRE